MPSPSIVRGIRTRIQKQLIPSVSSRWSKQLHFGLQAYDLQAFQSAQPVAAQTLAAMALAASYC
jgi:hypothetical protein